MSVAFLRTDGAAAGTRGFYFFRNNSISSEAGLIPMRQFAYITAVSLSFFFVLDGTSMALAQTISPETVPHPKGPYLTLEIVPAGNQIWNSATWRRRVQMPVKKVLLGTASLDDNRAIFDAWYKNYKSSTSNKLDSCCKHNWCYIRF